MFNAQIASFQSENLSWIFTEFDHGRQVFPGWISQVYLIYRSGEELSEIAFKGEAVNTSDGSFFHFTARVKPPGVWDDELLGITKSAKQKKGSLIFCQSSHFCMSVDLPEWFCPKKSETNAAAGILPSGSTWRPVGECPTVGAGWLLHTLPEATCPGNIKGEAATSNSFSSHCTPPFFFFSPRHSISVSADMWEVWLVALPRSDLFTLPCRVFMAILLPAGGFRLLVLDGLSQNRPRRKNQVLHVFFLSVLITLNHQHFYLLVPYLSKLWQNACRISC